jgi:hypothetical protein
MAITGSALTLALGACGSDSGHATTPQPAAAPPTAATSAPPVTRTAATATLLDTKHVEQAIVGSIKAQRKVTAHVSCPGAVLQEKGVMFECKADSSIGKATFVVTQTNDAGHVTYVAK